MSLVVEQELFDLMIGRASITNLIPVTDIRMGVQKVSPSSYPCIIITQVGGSERPYLGYGSSASGSKFAVETNSYQIDILSQVSPKKNTDVYDVIKVPLMTNGYIKTSDNSVLEEELDAYRMITRWEKIAPHTD